MCEYVCVCVVMSHVCYPLSVTLPPSVCLCVYLKIQVVQVPQQNEVLSTNLTNDIVLEEDGLDGEKTK